MSIIPVENSLLPYEFVSPDNYFSYLPAPVFRELRTQYRRFSYVIRKKKSPFELYSSEEIIFVHIPKNAGSNINAIVYPKFNGAEATKINAHHSTQYLKRINAKLFESYSKFAILRHPAARLKSAFNYIKYTSPFVEDQAFASKVLRNIDDYKVFCERMFDDEFRNSLTLPHFHSQSSFICDASGHKMVNNLIVLEKIESGMELLGKKFGKDWGGVSASKKFSLEFMDYEMAVVDAFYANDLLLWTKQFNAS